MCVALERRDGARGGELAGAGARRTRTGSAGFLGVGGLELEAAAAAGDHEGEMVEFGLGRDLLAAVLVALRQHHQRRRRGIGLLQRLVAVGNAGEGGAVK